MATKQSWQGNESSRIGQRDQLALMHGALMHLDSLKSCPTLRQGLLCVLLNQPVVACGLPKSQGANHFQQYDYL